jgi:hypothetical protein
MSSRSEPDRAGLDEAAALETLGRSSGPASLILSSLADGAKHGYALTKDIEAFAGAGAWRGCPGGGALAGVPLLSRSAVGEPHPGKVFLPPQDRATIALI